MHRTKPQIAITGNGKRWAPGWWFAWLSIAWAGGRALRATPNRPLPADIDGLVIGGGDDIATDLYEASTTYDHSADRERDTFEIDAIRHARDQGLPILGICRGAQLLNVAGGGNLYANISGLRKLTSNRVNPFACKRVAVKPGSRIASLGAQRLRVNSLHHQAVHRLGTDFVATARDADGFVQAIEARSNDFIIGVQWHPEYLFYRRAQRLLFAELVRAARGVRQKK